MENIPRLLMSSGAGCDEKMGARFSGAKNGHSCIVFAPLPQMLLTMGIKNQ